jgi:hypothetical protein
MDLVGTPQPEMNKQRGELTTISKEILEDVKNFANIDDDARKQLKVSCWFKPVTQDEADRQRARGFEQLKNVQEEVRVREERERVQKLKRKRDDTRERQQRFHDKRKEAYDSTEDGRKRQKLGLMERDEGEQQVPMASFSRSKRAIKEEIRSESPGSRGPDRTKEYVEPRCTNWFEPWLWDMIQDASNMY